MVGTKRYVLMQWSAATSELNNYLGYHPSKVQKQRVVLFSPPELYPRYLTVAYQVTKNPVNIIGNPEESEWYNEKTYSIDGQDLLHQLVDWGYELPPRTERRDDV